MRLTEGAQTVVAGEHDSFFLRRACPARIARDDLPDEPAIDLRLRNRQSRFETGMVKELPRRAHHHEAPVKVGRGRIGAEGGHRAGHRIEAVLPHQFVGVGKRIPLETEGAEGVVWLRTH